MYALRSLLVLVLAIGATTSSRAEDAVAHPTLSLERFFRGPLDAEGSFRSAIDGSVRHVRVKMFGRWNARLATLTLSEDFAFADGEMDRKTWRFVKRRPGLYDGYREDVIGVADVRQNGRDVTLAYQADLRGSSGTFRVSFNDLLEKLDSQTVRNTATVSWLFFRAGDVDLLIHRR